MPIYNKLVRDKIPKIIQKSGKKFHVIKLDEAEYKKELVAKLSEEIDEYSNTTSDEAAVEELADILEILKALANLQGTSLTQLEAIRVEKAEKRGGFEDRIYLIDVED